MVIDVSGDTDVSVANLGPAPVDAVQQTANQILVVNHSVSGAQADSLTKLNFSGTVISSTSTISLPENSAPNFVATTESSQAYVLMPNYVDPTTNAVVPSIQVVNTTANNLVATIPVGNNPDAMAETPNAQKLYVANQADSTIDGFNTADRSSRTVNGSFNGPLWLIARSDSQRLYVLNGNGVVSTVDTTSTLGPDNVIDASVNVPGAAYMLYDGNLNRLYIPGRQPVDDTGCLAVRPRGSCRRPDHDSYRCAQFARRLGPLLDDQPTAVDGGRRRRSAGWQPRLCRGLLRRCIR